MLKLRGAIPAHLLPFTETLAIDEPSLRRHLAWLLEQPIGGITTTAHASEVATCSPEERLEVLRTVVDAVAGKVPVIAGVYADATREACAYAHAAAAAGADALLVFPSPLFAEDAGPRGDMVVRHVDAVAHAAGLPLVIFQYPRATRMHYEPALLRRIAEAVPAVVAVKEWSLDISDYRASCLALRGLDRHVALLSSFSTSLMASLTVGGDGILSGHGSVVADLHCRLLDAVGRSDLAAARNIDATLHGLARVAYRPPFQDGHNRMKYALWLLGRIDTYAVRPPLLPIPEADRAAVRHSLAEAGLLD